MLRHFLYRSNDKWRLCRGRHLYVQMATSISTAIGQYIQCSDSCINDASDLIVFPNFVTEEEESGLMTEIDKTWRHTKYEYSHWDEAIIGFRETEKSTWKIPMNDCTVKRLINKTVTSISGKTVQPLQSMHIIDLAADGYIKPHIDSVKFCGDVIAGISLLSACVMKLTCDNSEECIMTLLPQRSLYIMRNKIRYDYAHEILSSANSYFKNKYIPRDRRVSIICRTKPDYNISSQM